MKLGIKAKGPRIKEMELSPPRKPRTLLRPKKLGLRQRKQRPRPKKLTQRPRTILPFSKDRKSSPKGQGLTTRLFMQSFL